MANYRIACFKEVRLSLLGLLLIITSFTSCQQKKADTGEYSEEFNVIFKNAMHLTEINKPEAGIHYLDSAMNHIHPTVNDRFRAYAIHYVYWKYTKGDNKRGLLYADSMLQMAQKNPNQKQYVANYAEASFARGDAYFDLRQYNESYLNYYQGYLIGKNNLNNLAMSDYTYRMGMIMYKQDHYLLAVNYFKESYKKRSGNDDDFANFYRKQELLDNIGLSYTHVRDIDSALAYFSKALNYIDKNASKFSPRNKSLDVARAVVYGNEADILTLKGDKDAAAALLKKSIAINLEAGNDNRDAQSSEIKLSQIYFDKHQDDSLINLLGNIRVQLDSVKNDDVELDWTKLMSKYYTQQKYPEKALQYFERYDVLKDTSISRSTTLRESNVIQQLANYEKQYQINNLKDNNKLQQFYLYVSAVVGVMAIAIVLLIFRNWRQSRRDIITVKALNEQINKQKASLEETLEELKKSDQEKDRILRNVAHDLRNPISGIASLTGVMVNEDDYSDEQKELLNLVRETANDTIELINEILEATSGGEAEITKQMVEINSLLNNSIELMRFKAAEKKQEIIIDPLNEPEQLYINREKIRRVISNLISNAIKFSPIGVPIHVKTTDKGDSIEISVSDQGIGIPQKIKDKIFNMFTEAKRPGTMGEKSFGLGLSICRQIVEKHNGRIWFESDGKNGTTFYVNLPKPAAAAIRNKPVLA